MLRKLFLSIALLLGLTAAAAAQSLDSLRASGAVGERFDGMAVARDSSAAGVVNKVNQQRLQIYQDRARQEGVSVQQVGEVYANQIRRSAPSGTWFQDRSGRWQR